MIEKLVNIKKAVCGRQEAHQIYITRRRRRQHQNHHHCRRYRRF